MWWESRCGSRCWARRWISWALVTWCAEIDWEIVLVYGPVISCLIYCLAASVADGNAPHPVPPFLRTLLPMLLKRNIQGERLLLLRISEEVPLHGGACGTAGRVDRLDEDLAPSTETAQAASATSSTFEGIVKSPSTVVK